VTIQSLSYDYTHQVTKDMFRKLKPAGPVTGKKLDQNPCEWIQRLLLFLTTRTLLAKKKRVWDFTKILLDIAKESSDWFPPLKSALGGVCALVKHYEVIIDWAVAVHDSCGRLQEFDDVKEKIEDLIPRLNMFKENAKAASVDGDQGEKDRRSALSGYAHRLLTLPTPVDDLSACWKKSRSDPCHCWKRGLPPDLWTRAGIPKRWRDSSSDFERLLATTK